MRLDEWMTETNVSVADLADAIGVRVSTVYRWCDGTRIPRPEHCRAIFSYTGGAVRADDFAGLPPVSGGSCT